MNLININPILAIDSYKLGHMTMYPKGTTKIYCNAIPRSLSRLEALVPKGYFDDKMVTLGTSIAVREIHLAFENNFFKRDIHKIIEEFKETITPFIGDNSNEVLISNIIKLYGLGYLPLEFKCLPEGMVIPAQTPVLTVTNTHEDFAWLPNYLETFISNSFWKISTAATIARIYKNIFTKFSEETCDNNFHITFQGHDFSARGMSGMEDSIKTGLGHLAYFQGSDSIHSALLVKKLYGSTNLIACSVPATEHSVMCLGSSNETETETFKRLIKQYNKGIVSIVSDTWDFWDTITNKALELKEDILNRTEDTLGLSKLVFRPDSGDPVKVICGDLDAPINSPEYKGAIECLWDIFGGTINDKGYKVLNSKVGLIYGDSITFKRAVDILEGLKAKKFASSNIVMGIGSYTYNYLTRDTLGYAIKATYAEIEGSSFDIAKAPKTDSGKKSMKGLLQVVEVEGQIITNQQVAWIDEQNSLLTSIYKDGKLLEPDSWDIIRARANK